MTDYIGVPGSVLQISFTLQDGTQILNCPGRIAWVNKMDAVHPRGFGVKFALMERDGKVAN
jgi:Tfp pilus assembly protein PilZ